jgi:hypothetical protein
MMQDDDLELLMERYLHDYQGSTPLPASVRDAVIARLPTTKQWRTGVGSTLGVFVIHRFPRAVVAMSAMAFVVVVGIVLLPARQGGPGASAPDSDLGVFEPARARVVYVTAGHLEALDPLDLSSPVVIDPGDLGIGPYAMAAGWSADGSMLALTDEYEGALYVMDATGSLDRVPIEELPDVAFGCCSFTTSAWLSPDGTQGLAFAQGEHAQAGLGKLYILDLADVGRSRAVEVDDFEVAQGPFGQDPMPVWSPDGSQVAYVWSKGGDIATPAVGIVDLANDSSRELSSGWGLIRHIAWSPDGSQLLIVAGHDAPEYGGQLNPLTLPQPTSLYAVDIDDAETHEIATGHYVAAAWSPDGSQIAALDGRTAVVVDVDASHDRRVLARRGLPAGDLWGSVVWHPIPPAPG